MAITVTCQSCQQPWAVVPGIGKAHPGRQSEAVTVQVPNEDVFGKPLGGTHEARSAHWVSAGPSARLNHMETDQDTTYAWSCLCGASLTYVTPRLYVVACQHNAGESGLCAKAAIRRNPPADLYVNARYGGACPCCGQQGTHMVTWDEPAPCGASAQGA